MAIKHKVKQLVDAGNVNRETQTSQRNLSTRGGGNESQTVIPGIDLSKQYSITLKDIDTSIIKYVKNVIKPTVQEANQKIKVTVMYGNEERWKSVRSRGVLRDKSGVIILPVMIVKRTGLAMNPDMPLSFDNDVRGKFISVVRSSNGWSKNNRYDRFSVLTGQKPVEEFVQTGMPDFVVCTYNIVMMTAYMEQMNDLNSIMIEHLETYWGDSTSYRFLSALSGDISDATEMESDGERIIKNELTIEIKGYMIPEFTDTVFGKTAEMVRGYTVKKVTFSYIII
jgi:hypothetical protein